MRGRNKDYIEQRAIESANYLIKNNSTIRETAKYMGVSKSTVHKDLIIRLKDINHSLYEKVREVLDANWEERYIRGGLATKERYERLKEKESAKNE
ncbi:putative DeoR family transcriptional regulator (stage III sporulation protein D) [Tissierella praeacuta]|uniref:sporulation transcriptional regulator SpoIIID n=1 Tax=Tissierella praeacuta TaxID=43131 RepID=UPI00104D0115|nr:sporulation transcriptional regulator SpoIIID [Tissierella praeacuta]TCU72893.1 putative DeoR family transcriptional regulator (stage III sporulation protein D) [Tissierella praeacuta]